VCVCVCVCVRTLQGGPRGIQNPHQVGTPHQVGPSTAYHTPALQQMRLHFRKCCETGVDVAVGAIQLVNGRKLMEHYDALTRRIKTYVV
jgi:hypothetical protein